MHPTYKEIMEKEVLRVQHMFSADRYCNVGQVMEHARVAMAHQIADTIVGKVARGAKIRHEAGRQYYQPQTILEGSFVILTEDEFRAIMSDAFTGMVPERELKEVEKEVVRLTEAIDEAGDILEQAVWKK